MGKLTPLGAIDETREDVELQRLERDLLRHVEHVPRVLARYLLHTGVADAHLPAKARYGGGPILRAV